MTQEQNDNAENILTKVFHRMQRTAGKSFGQAVAEETNGSNLVDGKQTWELASTHSNDIQAMHRCCDAELETYKKTGLVPAPYYFERRVILARKARLFQLEIDSCERYLSAVEEYYRINNLKSAEGVKAGPRYQAIVKRLPKAKELARKQGPVVSP